MNCPNCQETLLMTVRNNVEIDYCPKCRGIWLDRGELDKLLAHDQDKGLSNNEPQAYKQDQRVHDQRHQHGYGNNTHGYPKKKKSFLEDLFDF